MKTLKFKIETLKSVTLRAVLAVLVLAGVLGMALPARAVDRITAAVTFTPEGATTNGMTFTVNGNVRTWTNNVVVSSSQVLTNATAAGSKTNLYKAIGLSPFSQVVLVDSGITNFNLVGGSGVILTVTASAGWASVSYSTQVVSSLVGVRVPVSAEAAAVQTNVASGLMAALNSTANTNPAVATAPAFSATIVGVSNAQTVVGAKVFSSGSGLWQGSISNAPSISGTLGAVSNGVLIKVAITNATLNVSNGIWVAAALLNPTITNGQNFGNPFRSPGSASGSEQFGLGASASANNAIALGDNSSASGVSSVSLGSPNVTGIGAVGVGFSSHATGDDSTAAGFGATASGDSSLALGTLSTASGVQSAAVGVNATTTADNQVRLGTATETVSIPGGLQVEGSITNAHFSKTNTFPAGSDISFGRFALSSLANGNNAAVPVGTNVFVEVSGPSGAFTINGIAGGRDGKVLFLLNQTGFNMTLANASGTDPTAANRLVCLTGADKTVTGNSSATLIYSGAASRWIVLYFGQ